MLITITIDTINDKPEEVVGILNGIAKMFNPVPKQTMELPTSTVHPFIAQHMGLRVVRILESAKEVYEAHTIADICRVTDEELLKLKHCGMSTVQALRQAVSDCRRAREWRP